MRAILYTYKFRIYPNTKQILKLSKSFGCVRYVYNYFLNKEIEEYKSNKKHLGYYSNAKKLTKLKKELIWLKDCNSQSLQHTLKHLEAAYTNFFRGIKKNNKDVGLPRFKSKKNHNDSLTIPEFCTIDDKYIYFPKFKEGIRCKFHRQVIGNIKFFTISRTPSNKYYVSITVSKEHGPLINNIDELDKSKAIGIDVGINNLLTMSNGEIIDNPKYLDVYKRKLAKAQKNLKRKVKGSTSYNKQRIKIAKLYEKISNSRKDYLHKITTNLIKQYDYICIEDLDSKEMTSRKLKDGQFRREKQSLNRNLTDSSFGMFKSYLSYKALWNNKLLIKVNKYYPSSKTCHICGYKNTYLTLKDRYWTCPMCNSTHNRDLNASINILNEGLRSLSLGTNDYTGGATSISPTMISESTFSYLGDVAMISEAHKSLVCG